MSTGGTYVQQVNIKANLDISQAKSQISGLESAFRKLSLPKGMENSFNKVFTKMKSDLSQVEALMQKGLTSKADVNSFNKYTNSISTGYSKILTMINQLNGQKVTMKVDTTQIDKLKQKLSELQQNYNKALEGLASGKDSGGFGSTLSSIEKIASSSKIVKTNLEGLRGTLREGDFSAANSSLEKFVNGLTRLGSVKKIDIAKTLNLSEVTKQLGNETSRWSAEQNNFFKNAALQALTGDLNEAKIAANGLEMQMNDTAASINKIQSGNLEKVKTTLRDLGTTAEKAAQQQQKANEQAQEGVAYQYDKQMQVNDLRMQVQYFFGLQNMINLFKRGVRDAIATVKELDQAMTATAVVTDYSVSDMWGQLPEYTKRAQQLGTTIADMYNATTLYYQQGLDTEHAMGTAVETLKMARIAGIEGAEATDLMTAALRGFRMESNEVNASHVNDVYSALAASSASDTYEIGTAMSKVASLASSANMDLETTATFLAQIIETTREAPETAGTALKTIIARFGEVKKLSQEGLFTGTDEEGEVIDINKVDTALKTAGISLQDFINGNEGLDQVFLRLAERWDSLSVVQQRYIATQAAGARMQARFIAMMQDYGRTQELLNVANNAEGAGEKQFAKTAESLEFKLNQLKDAYHSFIMGIANSTAIKTVVDVLITGFDKVNSIIQTATGGVDNFNNGLNGILRTVLSVSTAFAALKVGGKVLNAGVDWLGGLILGKGTVSASRAAGNTGLLGGISGAKATAITAPILSKLDVLISLSKTGNKINSTNSLNKGETLTGASFLRARHGVNSLVGKGTTINDLLNQMGPYSAETQRAIMATSPGTSEAITDFYYQAVKKADLTPSGQIAAKGFINAQEKAFKTGKVDFTSYVKSASLASSKAFSKHVLDANNFIDQSGLLGVGSLQNEQAAAEWIRQRAIASRAKELFQESSVYKRFDEARSRGEDTGSYKATLKQIYDKKHSQALQEFGQLGEGSVAATKLEKVGNVASSIGASIASAGMALNSFSVTLSSLGADRAAAAISALGSAFTTVGMAASSAGNIFTSFNTIARNLEISVGAVGGIFAAVGLTIAGIIAVYKLHQNTIKKVRDEGKKVTKDYQKNVVEQKKAIKELSNGYKEYEQLRKGVDSKGNNLSLSEEDYARYQDYTDKLINMNKGLQQGINETGKAYIGQSADIKKVLAEEAKEAEQHTQLYLSNGSGQAIIDQVKTYKRIIKAFGKESSNNAMLGSRSPKAAAAAKGTEGELAKQAKNIKSILKEISGYENELQELGLGDLDFSNLDVSGFKKIYDQAPALSSFIESSDLDDKAKKSVSKSISALTKTYNEAVEAAATQTDWLETYLDYGGLGGADLEKKITDKFSKGRYLTNIGKEQASLLTGGFREGLEELSLTGIQEGWDAADFKKNAVDYASSIEKLTKSTGDGKKYSEALNGIAAAQKNFNNNISKKGFTLEEASNQYKTDVAQAMGTLNELESQYREAADNGSVVAGKIADGIHEGMLKAASYTAEGSERIAENLNSLSGSFESANAAVESYQEQTKDLKDFYTAAEGMKSILEDIGYDYEKKQFSGTDVEGHGSQKFWLAARNLVDEKELDKGFNHVKSKISEIAPMLQEGKKGYESFISTLHQHYANKDLPGLEQFYKETGNGKFKIKVDDASLGKMANLLGVSDDLLASMLNKSRQFMDWDLSNIEELATSIQASDQIMGGGLDKDKTKFYNYDQLELEGYAQNLTRDEIRNIADNLEKEGVKVINLEDLAKGDQKQREKQQGYIKDLVSSYGFKKGQSIEDYVKPFAKSGQYDAEETAKILRSAGLIDKKQTDSVVEAYEKLSAGPEVAMADTATNTGRSADLLAEILATIGQSPKELSEGVNNLHKEVFGGKGVDTKAQHYGHGENEDGKYLNYQERKEGLTDLNTKLLEAQDYQKYLKEAKGNAKTDEEKDVIQASIDKNKETIESLKQWATYGSAGLTTAKKLLGGNAENFKFGGFFGEEGTKKLLALDEQLSGIKKLNFGKLHDAILEADLNRTQRQSVLGQYSKQRFEEEGIKLPKDVEAMQLGKVLGQRTTDGFVDALKTKLPQLSGKATETLRQQFAEYKGWNFNEEYFDLVRKTGVDTSTKNGAAAQEILDKEGFSQEVELVFKEGNASEIQKTLSGLADDADRIRVIDSLFNLRAGVDTENELKEIQELTGLSEKEINALLKIKADTTEAKKEKKEVTKPEESKVKVKTDTAEAKKEKKEVTKPEESKVKVKTDATEAKKEKKELTESTESTHTEKVTFQFPNGNPLGLGAGEGAGLGAGLTNPTASSTPFTVDTIFKPKVDEVNEEKESIKKPEPNVKVNFEVGKTSSVDSKKKSIQQNPIKQTVKQESTASIKFKGNNKDALEKRAEAAKNDSGTIFYKGENSDALRKRAAAAKDDTATITITANTEGIEAKLSALARKIAKVKADAEAWTGRNNHRMGAYSTGYNSVSLSSFASGKKRTTKGNTMSALTGELGPEMAWYPKEGRAELLGVGGPQFVPDLPKDSVIWNARQTEEILKRKSIPLNSFASGSGKIPGSGSGGSSGGSKQTPKQSITPKITKKSDDKTSAAVAQATGGIYKIDVQIYNLTKKIEQTANKIEKNSDTIKDKLSNSIDFSYSQIRSTVSKQSSLLRTQNKDNKKLTAKYNKKLLQLNAGKGRYKKYQISYEKKVKKSGKDSKETKTKNVNLGKYIKKSGDAYVLDYKALRKAAKSKKLGKNYAKAVMEAAQKEIDDLSSKKLSANKAADEAKKKLQELRKELQDTLFAWENELTEIKNLENQISLGDSYTKATDSLQELVTKMVSSPLSNVLDISNIYLKTINANLDVTKTQLNQQRSLIEAYRQQLKDDLSLTDEYSNLDEAKAQREKAENELAKAEKKADKAKSKKAKKTANKNVKKARGELEKAQALEQQRKDELDLAQVGKRFVSTTTNPSGQIEVTFDWETFEKERLAGNINTTERDAITKYYEKIIESVEKTNDLISDQASKLASYYGMRDDQYQMMSDYTQKIREGMEEEEQKTIDNLSDLNKSIQDAFKDLIDNVKKELDKQRKAEQNQKDEEDISNKMNRLAMLRADTSGSNAAEIAKLEKEINEDTGKYEDSLEDQLLDRLQDQADEAAKQREKQIEILTAQLNYSKSAGAYLAKAENLVQKIVNGTATNEQKKLAQLYYLGSDDLLDRWGRQLEKWNFDADTLKVENFNTAVKSIEEGIKKTIDYAQELLEDFLKSNSNEGYNSRNLQEIKESINKNSIDTQTAFNNLINEGGMDKDDAAKFLKNDKGYTAEDFKKSGLSIETAKSAGFNLKEMAEGGYTAKEAKEANYSVKKALDVFGKKKTVEAYGTKAVAKTNAGKSSKATLDTNGKAKGGKIKKGTVNKSGTKVAAQKKGAVYVQDYKVDANTGKGAGTGKTKKVDFADFTANFVKNNQKEASKELLWQLNNKKIGTQLHKNWKKLIGASNIKSGTEVNLKGKNKGTITKSGDIYYNTSKGIGKWNPTKGETSVAKKYENNDASKKEFLKEAQKNKGVSREYAQFLIAKKIYTKKQLENKKVKEFATGGKADFTGPAWLDGTPSKPELILNSTDTKNFLALKDVLSEATKRGVFNHDNSTDNGDMNFDITINVDKIDSDYDVDKVAERVKKIIIKEAKTRNVTVTGRAR